MFAQVKIKDEVLLNVFNLHMQSNDMDGKPASHQHNVNEIRQISFKEVSYFVEEILHKEFKFRGDASLSDLTLLCGDFNLHREPMNEHTIKFMEKDQEWKDHLAYMDKEYHHLIDTLKLDGVFHVSNLWDE